MNELYKIKQQMCKDSYMSYKGESRNLKEPFIYIKDEIPYIIFIVENRSLDRKKTDYNYGVFSVKNNCCINKNSTCYQKIVKDFPSLNNINGFNLAPDFEIREILAKEFDEILQSLMDVQKLTEDNKKRYISYLKSSQRLKKETVKRVYSYFIDVIEEKANGTI